MCRDASAIETEYHLEKEKHHEVRKKRLKKFKQHSKENLAPYAQEIAESEATNILKLAMAINGVIYQHVGDEDCCLKRAAETLAIQSRCLEEAIRQYDDLINEDKKYLSINISDDKTDETNIVNAHLTQIVFRAIQGQKPVFFFYTIKNYNSIGIIFNKQKDNRFY